jgi:hypothetical protein
LPITWKTLTKRGEYDEYVETNDFQAKEEQDAERIKLKHQKSTFAFLTEQEEKLKKDLIRHRANSMNPTRNETVEKVPVKFPAVVVDFGIPLVIIVISALSVMKSYHAIYLTKKFDLNSSVIKNSIQASKESIMAVDDKLYTNDVIFNGFDRKLFSLFRGRKPFSPPAPDVPDQINSYFLEPSSNGSKASTLKEAWVMAYIEKHQREFKYNNITINTYEDRNTKRDAIIKLVKSEGAEKLFDTIAPLKRNIKLSQAN